MSDRKIAEIVDGFEAFESILKSFEKNPVKMNSKKPPIVQGNQFSLATIGKVFARFVGKHDVLPQEIVDGEYDFLDPIKMQVREITDVFEANREEILDNADEPELAASTIKKLLNLTYPVKAIEKAIIHAIDKAENYLLSGNKLKPTGEVFQDLINDLDDPRQTMLKTGFDLWDYKLNGGLCDSGLHILAAPSSRGKSALGIQVATNVALNGKKVIYFSLEMSNKQNMARILATLDDRINSSRVLSKDITKEEKELIINAKEKTNKLCIFFSQTQNIHFIVKEIKENIALMKEVDLILIDYIQLIECDITGQINSEVRVATATKKLKNLSLKHNLRILALAQMNEKNSEKPGSGDLRSSAAIWHFAETVTFIKHKEEQTIKGDDGNPIIIPARTWLDVAKNRNGGPAMAPEITMDHAYFYKRGLFRQEQSLHDKLKEQQRQSEEKAKDPIAGEPEGGHHSLLSGSPKNNVSGIAIPAI